MFKNGIAAYRYRRINGKTTVEIYYLDGTYEIISVEVGDDEGQAMLPKVR